MSTRATIAHDNHFHLYREVFDEDCVYLELMNPTEAHIETRAGSGSVVVVAIPEDTWKKIVEGWLGVKDT